MFERLIELVDEFICLENINGRIIVNGYIAEPETNFNHDYTLKLSYRLSIIIPWNLRNSGTFLSLIFLGCNGECEVLEKHFCCCI